MDMLHVDVMDGHFVPEITIGPVVVKRVAAIANVPLHVHLMVERPEEQIEHFMLPNCSFITVHVETSPHLHRIVERVRNNGCKAGVALNPSTPIGALEEILRFVDVVVVMSVNPGYGGQKFIDESLQKIEKLRRTISDSGLNVRIAVDGGVKVNNAKEVVKAGADILVAGSAIFHSRYYRRTVEKFKEQLVDI